MLVLKLALLLICGCIIYNLVFGGQVGRLLFKELQGGTLNLCFSDAWSVKGGRGGVSVDI